MRILKDAEDLITDVSRSMRRIVTVLFIAATAFLLLALAGLARVAMEVWRYL
jgi:hypothetical protein